MKIIVDQSGVSFDFSVPGPLRCVPTLNGDGSVSLTVHPGDVNWIAPPIVGAAFDTNNQSLIDFAVLKGGTTIPQVAAINPTAAAAIPIGGAIKP
jgi:hypothetical protein